MPGSRIATPALRKPDGWLSLAGLFWLEQGESTFGSDPANDVVFPTGAAPPRVGVFVVAAGQATLASSACASIPESTVTHDGAPVTEMELVTDAAGEPTLLELGSLLFHAIDRGGRIAHPPQGPLEPSDRGVRGDRSVSSRPGVASRGAVRALPAGQNDPGAEHRRSRASRELPRSTGVRARRRGPHSRAHR